MRAEISPYPCNTLSSIFFTLVILVCVKWYHTEVLIYLSLMTNKVEHLFMFILAICISSLENVLLKIRLIFFFEF